MNLINKNIFHKIKIMSLLLIVFSVIKKANLSLLYLKYIVKYKLNERLYFNVDIQNKILRVIGDYSKFNPDNFQNIDKIIELAEEILNHKFRILGYQTNYDWEINWHKDFNSGFIWEKGKYFRKYKQVDLSNNADVKVPRELSRSHHLLLLGQAYIITKNEKYVKEYMDQIEDWIDENPLMYSINWGCTMDVAIRAVNWIYSFNMMQESRIISKTFVKKIRKSLYEHGWYIYRNPENNYFNNGNHYDADLAGQVLLGLLFSETSEGKMWLDNAREEINKEIRTQVLPSGVVYEKTTNYIRLVNEIFLVSYIWLSRNAYYIPADVKYRIEKMFEFILYSTKGDGKQPIIGDQDDASFLPFQPREPMDSRFLLSTASIIFNREDFKFHSNGYLTDCYFLLGADSKIKYDAVNSIRKYSLESKGFEDAGFYIMRKDDICLFINNSGQAKYFDLASSIGSHTHADLLSFELAVGSRTFLVDPGSYIYTADAKSRNLFRSTKMHNTAVIGNEDQYIINSDNLFGYGSKAYPVSKWETSYSHDRFIGQHDGYLRLSNKVLHTREIIFDKNKYVISIIDIFNGLNKNNIEIYFHFDAGIDFDIDNEAKIVYTKISGERNLKIELIDNLNICKLRKLKSHVSKHYGNKLDSITLVILYENIVLPIKSTVKISIVND